MTNTYTVLVEKPEGSKQLDKSRRRWENTIKMDLKRERVDVYTGLF
jgi:hypothetical protein